VAKAVAASTMKVAIIGAGWAGCHLALRLRDEHEVTIFDPLPFEGASLLNQNRLHMGYHYARNHPTRELCQSTFEAFMRDYGPLTEPVKDNFYAVPMEESLMDARTIEAIFPPLSWPHQQVDVDFLENTEMVWRTPERYISPLKTKSFMIDQLSSSLRLEHIDTESLPAMQQDYSLIIDCTNNGLLHPAASEYFEAVAMFIYNTIKPLPFGALTYIDGPLFSVYPFHGGTISLSHVVHSVIHSSTTPIALQEIAVPSDAMHKAERHVKMYWPAFSDHLSFSRTVVSMKSKRANASAYRAPLFKQQEKILSCFTGKIQGIYLIEEKVKEVLSGL
jgi:hypothetical protein